MKKTLLTLGAVAAVAASASAQGLLTITGVAGFNTVSSSSSASAATFYSGTVSLQVFTIASGAAGAVNLANTINTDEESLSSVLSGVSLIESNFTAQLISPLGGGTQASSLQGLVVNNGFFTSGGNTTVGSASSLPNSGPSEVDIYYALVFTAANGDEAAVVLNNPSGGYDPSTSPPNSETAGYPSNDQNLLLAPVAPTPEPATLALAGLGGLSMLFLRRRKA